MQFLINRECLHKRPRGGGIVSVTSGLSPAISPGGAGSSIRRHKPRWPAKRTMTGEVRLRREITAANVATFFHPTRIVRSPITHVTPVAGEVSCFRSPRDTHRSAPQVFIIGLLERLPTNRVYTSNLGGGYPSCLPRLSSRIVIRHDFS